MISIRAPTTNWSRAGRPGAAGSLHGGASLFLAVWSAILAPTPVVVTLRLVNVRCKGLGPRKAQNAAMETDLTTVVTALAGIGDTESRALITAAYDVPQTAPGLLAWAEHVCDWEQHRRLDFDLPLQPPEAAIDPSQDEVSINGAMVLRD